MFIVTQEIVEDETFFDEDISFQRMLKLPSRSDLIDLTISEDAD